MQRRVAFLRSKAQVHRRDGEEPAEREAPGNEGQGEGKREALRHAFFPVVFFPVQGKKPTAERLYAAQVVPRTKTDSLLYPTVPLAPLSLHLKMRVSLQHGYG